MPLSDGLDYQPNMLVLKGLTCYVKWEDNRSSESLLEQIQIPSISSAILTAETALMVWPC